MPKTKKPKGFTPSPFFASWWGSLAERVWRVAPLKRKLSSRSEIPHKTQEDKTPEQKCPCEAFTMCDQYYQDMDPIVKDAWRFCVKKRGISGYGLFMKECLCLLIAGYNFPRTCSPSGGYNCITVEPGDEVPPLEGFIGQAHVRYRCLGPPDWKCIPSPQGAYETLEACQAVCHAAWPWNCTGAPGWDCVQEEDGLYETENLCIADCFSPLNTCNRCDPPIPDTLYMENAGLALDFAQFNDKRAVRWVAACVWDSAPSFPSKTVYWEPLAGKQWYGTTNSAASCYKEWRGTFDLGNPCDPTEPYFQFSCIDTACGDSDSCEDSAGATCVVSMNP